VYVFADHTGVTISTDLPRVTLLDRWVRQLLGAKMSFGQSNNSHGRAFYPSFIRNFLFMTH